MSATDGSCADGRQNKILLQDLPDLVLFKVFALLPLQDLANMYAAGTRHMRAICGHPLVLKHVHNLCFQDLLYWYLQAGDAAREFLRSPDVLRKLGGYVVLYDEKVDLEVLYDDDDDDAEEEEEVLYDDDDD